MYKCIIFDVDGTMLDTGEAVYLSYNRVIFEEFGRNITEDEMKLAYGVPTMEALKRLGFKNIDETFLKYNKYLKENFKQVKPFTGIEKILEAVKKMNIITGIVTSRDREEVYSDPCIQKLLKYFDYVISADDTQKHKPNPEPVLKLLEKAELNSSGTLYIGDTYYDYKCAKDAGVDFALALWGAKYKEGIYADYELKEPEELITMI